MMIFVGAWTDRFWLMSTLAWKIYIAPRWKALECMKSIWSRVTMSWKAFVRSSLEIREPEKFGFACGPVRWVNEISPSFVGMATSADPSVTNAKDMNADPRNPSGTVEDTAVLQVRYIPPLHLRRCNSSLTWAPLCFRRCNSSAVLPPPYFLRCTFADASSML